MSISNIGDFIKKLNKIPKKEGFEYYYRGHSSTFYGIEPSIYRDECIENEDKIFKEIILRTPAEFINDKTTLEKLVKMQHYGLPTRLLDITSNPLVALFFACQFSRANKKGVVLMFEIPRSEIKFYDSDTVSILSNLARRPVTFDISKNPKRDLDKFNTQGQIPFLLHEIKDEKPQFLPIIKPKDFNRVLTVKAKLNNDRIVKQSGAFLLFGINGEKRSRADVPKEWILNKSLPNAHFHVLNSKKQAILEELDRLAINESTLFPDIQSQAKHIKKQYEWNYK